MNGLVPEQRATLILSVFEGMSNLEIAEAVGCSEGAVEQRLVRARFALRQRSQKMNSEFPLTDERLERLARMTQSIRPSPGFEQRVFLAVMQSGNFDWRAGLWRVGRYGLVLSLVAVVLATVFAVQGASRADEMQAMSYGTVDLEW